MAYNPSPRSHRCSKCDQNWPLASYYEKCPLCGAETWTNTAAPLTGVEIQEMETKRKLHEKFENYYFEREVKLLHESLEHWDSPLC